MMKTTQWLHTLLPDAFLVDRYERLRTCCGALIGILITGLVSYMLVGRSMALPFLIAPMGASAVLLYAVPSSPMAQPWPVIGGNVVSAAVGVAAAKLIADPPLAAAVAVGGAIGAMFLLRCLHPPGGAAALTAVLGDTVIQEQGFNYALSPVALNAMVMVLVAIVFNNLVRRQYPYISQPVQRPQQTADVPPSDRIGVTPEDLNAVLREYNQVLDISREELTTLLMQAEQQAYRRRTGEVTCADIMSRDVITVEQDTPLEEAWSLMRSRHIKALPVIDAERHVVGIVTKSDFMKHAGLEELEDFGLRFRNFVRRGLRPGWEKAELVGQIMTKPARTAKASAHIVELVPVLSDGGFHHLPIVDEEDRLAGIVTQSDLVAALYRKRIVPSPVNAVSGKIA
jgi:CBS domain-containing membrane protein